MKVGGSIYPVTEKLLKHSEAQVVTLNSDGTVDRIVDPTEYANMTVEEMNAEPKKEAPAPKKKAAKKKAAKKKAAPKEDAVSDVPDALETIDVSSI